MPRKPLPPPTLANLYPPVRNHAYFAAAAELPFAVGGLAANAANRWWMAEHALLAYADPETIARTLAPQGYRVACLSDARSNTFVYLAAAADHGVLAFRGTEALTPGDSLLKLGNVARNWLTDARSRRRRWTDGGQVHRGFARAFEAIWPALAATLDRGRPWWCTGHSLGGALAALAALRLHSVGHRLEAAVTFGQPRTGDAEFARALDALPVVRVVNACDLVARMPPESLGFAHTRSVVHLDAANLARYGATVGSHLASLPATLVHGVGALTPIELIDHAPLHYAIKCNNAACDEAATASAAPG